MKLLQVIRRLKEDSPLAIRATFLEPMRYLRKYKTDPDRYVDLIVGET
ncbi:MAG: hypothetical protein R2751_08305 [Bacteroidales bacterium]